MPCFVPLRGYRAKDGSGKIVFDVQSGWADLPVTAPCGQCIGCRVERTRSWAVRCVHEASLHDHNCFITLTYSDDQVPMLMGEFPTLYMRDWQLFMKRLRKRFGPTRFFQCGEYGPQLGRPHYHACLFGLDFPDKVVYSSKNGKRTYTSVALGELWPHGFHTIGDMTYQSAAYVAAYVLKKVTGEQSETHYERVSSWGEVGRLVPEYACMSRRPGIGYEWFKRWRGDAFPSDFIVHRGKKLPVPRYYTELLKRDDEKSHRSIKAKRKQKSRADAVNKTPARLKVREQVAEAKLRTFKRPMEEQQL